MVRRPLLSSLFDISCMCANVARCATGLVLEGASWATDKLVLNDGETIRLGPSQIRWVQMDDAADAAVDTAGAVNLPVYLNGDRNAVLFNVDLPFDSAAGSLVATRAVCLTAGG